MTALSPQAPLLPLESLVLPADLDGHAGANRASTGCQVRASNDLEAIGAWLSRVRHSPTTFQAYRKEAERLLLWALIERGRPLSSLQHEDLVAYESFLANPTPAERWVCPGGQRRPRNHPLWRPFAGALSPSSVQLAMRTLAALFSWLVGARYLEANPLMLRSRRRSTNLPGARVRFLDRDAWTQICRSIEEIPQEEIPPAADKARARWLVSLFYLTGLRISEAVKARMGDFSKEVDRDGSTRWWLQVTGKGSKVRRVPATPQLMAELGRYRISLGLPEQPSFSEDWMAIQPLRGALSSEPLTRAALHNAFKAIFDRAAERSAREAGAAQAEHLRQASAHWLRHTAGTRMSEVLPLQDVRETLGHSSLNTTSLYVHTEEHQRYDAALQVRLDWPMP